MIIYGDQNVLVPAHLNFGKYVLDHLRNIKPDDVCLHNVRTGEQMTYRELIKYAVGLSVGLSELGVKNGDIVGVGSESRIKFLPTTLAVVLTGAAYTAFDVESGRATLEHQLEVSRPNYFICSDLFWKTNGDILKKCAFIKTYVCFDETEEIDLTIEKLMRSVDVETFEPPDVQGQTDTALIRYSSGTTGGLPKAVELTHLQFILRIMPNKTQDSVTSKRTLFYGAWYSAFVTFPSYKVFFAGGKIMFVEDITNYDNLLKIIQDYQIMNTMLLPSFLIYMAEADLDKYDLSSLRKIIACSAPLQASVIEKINKKLPHCTLLQEYGLGECARPISEVYATKGPRPGSVGMACPGAVIKVVDTKTRIILGANQRGEICVKTPFLMKGYKGYKDSSMYLDDQGFFLSGDLGYYDEDKYFYIVGRLKDSICHNGREVAPFELETILQRHPGVRAAGVVGKPAGPMQEVAAAFVVRRPDVPVTEQELIDFIAREVPPYMQLFGGVKFVTELPYNVKGKLLRRELRKML